MRVTYEDIIIYIVLIHTELIAAVSVIPSSPLLLPPHCLDLNKCTMDRKGPSNRIKKSLKPIPIFLSSGFYTHNLEGHGGSKNHVSCLKLSNLQKLYCFVEEELENVQEPFGFYYMVLDPLKRLLKTSRQDISV